MNFSLPKIDAKNALGKMEKIITQVSQVVNKLNTEVDILEIQLKGGKISFSPINFRVIHLAGYSTFFSHLAYSIFPQHFIKVFIWF